MNLLPAAMILLLVSMCPAVQDCKRDGGNADQWDFRHYPSAADFKGKPRRPLLRTAAERKFEYMIRTQARMGPNFAGHFTLAHWGCGSPCMSFVIVDARSGNIYEPGITVGCADENGVEASIQFHLKSRLVMITGYSEEQGCGTEYYEWNGKKLKLFHFEPWPKSDDDS